MKKKHFAALLLVLLLALGTSAQVLADEPDAEGSSAMSLRRKAFSRKGPSAAPRPSPGSPWRSRRAGKRI